MASRSKRTGAEQARDEEESNDSVVEDQEFESEEGSESGSSEEESGDEGDDGSSASEGDSGTCIFQNTTGKKNEINFICLLQLQYVVCINSDSRLGYGG